MKKKFSSKWKNSEQRRKKRKYRANAPLHIRQKFVNVHLSKELREKHKRRSVGVKKGDKVKIMRGKFKGETGKVEEVDLKKLKIYVTDIETVKKDGTKKLFPLEPSNLMITDMKIDDKMRKKSVEK